MANGLYALAVLGGIGMAFLQYFTARRLRRKAQADAGQRVKERGRL